MHTFKTVKFCFTPHLVKSKQDSVSDLGADIKIYYYSCTSCLVKVFMCVSDVRLIHRHREHNKLNQNSWQRQIG